MCSLGIPDDELFDDDDYECEPINGQGYGVVDDDEEFGQELPSCDSDINEY